MGSTRRARQADGKASRTKSILTKHNQR